MSDNWIIFAPADPNWVPTSQSTVEQAQRLIREAFPDAEEHDIKVSDRVEFIDCGQNFEDVACPFCSVSIIDWWGEAIGDALQSDVGPVELSVVTPCCGKQTSLNDLVYDWQCAFARCEISAMNPNVAELPPGLVDRLEAALSTKLKTVFQHI